MRQRIEVQVTAVRFLVDGEDPTDVAQRILGDLRNAERGWFRVELDRITHREGRRILRRFTYAGE